MEASESVRPGMAVPSEKFSPKGVPLEVGSEAELRCLPPERHSALVADHDYNIHIRLRCRKNRPEGSLLTRSCSAETQWGIDALFHSSSCIMI